MDLRELEVFLVVAEELHFGRAGIRLGMSTSRVSQQVRRLERRLGVRLFDRTSRRVELTGHGAHLLREARPAFTAIERALAEVSTVAGARPTTLRVGFSATLPPDLPDELIRRFEERYPHCRVVQSGHPTADLLGWIGGQWPVDVLVTWLPENDDAQGFPDTVYGPVIAHVPRAAAMAADHPLATRSVVDYEELTDYEVIYFELGMAERFSRVWTPPSTASGRLVPLRKLFGRIYLEEVMRVVSEGRAVHLTFASLPSRQQFPGVTYVPLTGLPPMPVRTIWPNVAHHPLAPVFAALATDLTTDKPVPRQPPKALASCTQRTPTNATQP